MAHLTHPNQSTEPLPKNPAEKKKACLHLPLDIYIYLRYTKYNNQRGENHDDFQKRNRLYPSIHG